MLLKPSVTVPMGPDPIVPDPIAVTEPSCLFIAVNDACMDATRAFKFETMPGTAAF